MANRVTFLVDGFNLYFSVRHAGHQFSDPEHLDSHDWICSSRDGMKVPIFAVEGEILR